MPLASKAWFLSGPTAVGKSAIGLALARRLGAEIVSMDSMALFRGMDIGTAKPTPRQRADIPHHLIDVAEPHEDFSLARYLDLAREAAAEIQSRGRQVLFVGGTPLYLKGLLRGVFEGPAADWDFRHALMAELEDHDPDWLHKKLEGVDPAAAARLHRNDARRIIRALEVFEKTGQTMSSLQQQFDRGLPPDSCRVFVLDRPREELHARIDQRVDAMFAAGLVDEVQRLMADPRGISRTAGQAVGYAELIDYLHGKHDLEMAISLVKTHTRQLAKRQATWFRSLSECRFVNISGDVDADSIAQYIYAL